MRAVVGDLGRAAPAPRRGSETVDAARRELRARRPRAGASSSTQRAERVEQHGPRELTGLVASVAAMEVILLKRQHVERRGGRRRSACRWRSSLAWIVEPAADAAELRLAAREGVA